MQTLPLPAGRELNWLQRTAVALARGALRVAFPGMGGQSFGPSWFQVLLPNSQFDYAREVGPAWLNSAVWGCLRYILTNITEPRLYVQRVRGKGKGVEIEGHALPQLLRRPNGDYSGKTLYKATALSWNVNGNAYWYIRKDNLGRPLQLWWLPHWSVWPQWPADGSEFISHYAYRPDGGGKIYSLAKEDVIHFRNGIDPHNQRFGLAPFQAILRETFADNELSVWEAALARNSAIPGLIISPGDKDMTVSEPGRLELKERLRQLTGDGRGEPLVPPYIVKVDRLSLTPKELSTREGRMTKEERIAAAFGIPAVVAGLGAGLEKATYSNMEQAEQQAYLNNIVPTLDDWDETLDVRLLPLFGNTDREDVRHDYSQVRCMQEDLNEVYEQNTNGVSGCWMMVAEARERAGLPVEETDRVYLRPSNVTPVKTADEEVAPPVLSSGMDEGEAAPGEEEESE